MARNLYIAREILATGEVQTPISLAEWSSAARSLAGFRQTDTIVVKNPFTKAPLSLRRPGSGVWVLEQTHEVKFACGAARVQDVADTELPHLQDLANRLSAQPLALDFPIFTTRRTPLPHLLRSLMDEDDSNRDVFVPLGSLCTTTTALVVSPFDPLRSPEDRLARDQLALSLGFPFQLPPIETLTDLAHHANNPQDFGFDDAEPRTTDAFLVDVLQYFIENDAFPPHE